MLDLRIAHDRFGSSSDPNINGHLHYPNDLDGSLNEATAAKIRQYRADYTNRPSNSISFMPAIASTSGRLHSELVRLLFLQDHFSSQLKSKVGNILAKAAALRITLKIDIGSKSYTHASHSQTSRC